MEMDKNAEKSGWFSRMRARLMAVPRRVWLAFWPPLWRRIFCCRSGVGLAFGGERGGGDASDSLVISSGEAAPGRH